MAIGQGLQIAIESLLGPDLCIRQLKHILMKRARIEGFIIIDYFPRLGEFIADMSKWVGEGKIKYDTTVVKGIENALTALNMLFTGGNTGKLLVQVSEET